MLVTGGFLSVGQPLPACLISACLPACLLACSLFACQSAWRVGREDTAIHTHRFRRTGSNAPIQRQAYPQGHVRVQRACRCSQAGAASQGRCECRRDGSLSAAVRGRARPCAAVQVLSRPVQHSQPVCQTRLQRQLSNAQSARPDSLAA
jgi:hypothetical protein